MVLLIRFPPEREEGELAPRVIEAAKCQILWLASQEQTTVNYESKIH